MELISIIVPIYKVEDYLDRCVGSIVEQTYKELEIILVDDGSPDNCPQMCDAWAEKDSRIKVVHKNNGGLSDARNTGLRIATGDYISFVDSDDWVEKGFIKTLYDVLQQESADIAECGVAYKDEEGNAIRTRSCMHNLQHYDKINALRALIKEDSLYQTVWNKLYKREIIEGVLFEVGKLNEDDFWTYQVFDRSTKITVIKDPLYNYCQRNSSIMGEGFSIKRLDGFDARVRRMEYLQKYPETADYTKARIQFDCLFNYQSALKYLNGEEQVYVTGRISQILDNLGTINYKDSDISKKYQIWFKAFRKWPKGIASIRNRLGIGL